MSCYIVIDGALPIVAAPGSSTATAATATTTNTNHSSESNYMKWLSTSSADLAMADALREDILHSKHGVLLNDADEKSLKVGFEDISLLKTVQQQKSSNAIAAAPPVEVAKSKPLGLFKKIKQPVENPPTSQQISSSTSSTPVSGLQVKMSMLLHSIKEHVKKNSSALNISSVDMSKNVRVFPRIYDNGHYRTFARKFPTSAKEEDFATSILAPDEIKVYFELFLNEEGDEWTSSDGGQTLLRYYDTKDEVVSISPKRNRLLLVSMTNNRLQAVNEVITNSFLRISISGCIVCKAAVTIGGSSVGVGGVVMKSRKISSAPLLMTESKLIPRFYTSELDVDVDGDGGSGRSGGKRLASSRDGINNNSKSKRKRRSNIRFWSIQCPINHVQTVKLFENATLHITQIALHIDSDKASSSGGDADVYREQRKKTYTVVVTAVPPKLPHDLFPADKNSKDDLVTIVNAQLQFQQSEIVVIDSNIACANELEHEFLEISVRQNVAGGSGIGSSANSSRVSVSVMGFYEFSSGSNSNSKSIENNNSLVSGAEEDEVYDDDSDNSSEEDVDPDEYMNMIMTEIAELGDKRGTGGTGAGGGGISSSSLKEDGQQNDDDDDDDVTLSGLTMEALNAEDFKFLADYINPKYLDMKNIGDLQSKFYKNNYLKLGQFFCNELIDEVQRIMISIPDDRGGARIGSNSSNGDSNGKHKQKTSSSKMDRLSSRASALSTSSSWKPFFDDKNNFSIFNNDDEDETSSFPSSSASSTTSITAANTETAPQRIGKLLSKLSDTLLSTKPFAKWLFAVTNVIPAALSSSVRRFKGGDYMLSQSQVDATRNFNNNGKALCFDACFVKEREGIRMYRKLRRGGVVGDGAGTTNVSEASSSMIGSDDSDLGPSVDANGDSIDEGWALGEFGGYQGYMDGDLAEDVKEGSEGKDEDGKEYDEEKLDSAELLNCPAGFNKLCLVLQDEGVLNYVKYLSHSAVSDRFDINGVYEFFYLKEDGEDDEDDDDDDDDDNDEDDDDDDDGDDDE